VLDFDTKRLCMALKKGRVCDVFFSHAKKAKEQKKGQTKIRTAKIKCIVLVL